MLADMMGMVFFGFFIITGLAICVVALQKGYLISGLAGIVLIVFGICGFNANYRLHEYDVLKETPAAVATEVISEPTTASASTPSVESLLNQRLADYDNLLAQRGGGWRVDNDGI